MMGMEQYREIHSKLAFTSPAIYQNFEVLQLLDISDAENFTEDEAVCNCGCGQLIIRPQLVYFLQGARTILGFPLPISSWNRCPTWNRKNGGTDLSSHIYAYAADIPIHPRDHRKRRIITLVLDHLGCPIIKVGKRADHIHVDVNPGKVWYTLLVV